MWVVRLKKGGRMWVSLLKKERGKGGLTVTGRLHGFGLIQVFYRLGIITG